MNAGMIGTVQHQQDTKSLHQELNGTVDDKSRGQLKGNCTSHHQVWDMTRRYPVPTSVLYRPGPPHPGYGYRFLSGAVIGLLLYMDDIKLYARSERGIDSLIHITRIYSNYMRMS